MSRFFDDLTRDEQRTEESLRRYVESLGRDPEPWVVATCVGEVDETLGPDEYDPEDARLYGELRREGWPVS